MGLFSENAMFGRLSDYHYNDTQRCGVLHQTSTQQHIYYKFSIYTQGWGFTFLRIIDVVFMSHTLKLTAQASALENSTRTLGTKLHYHIKPLRA